MKIGEFKFLIRPLVTYRLRWDPTGWDPKGPMGGVERLFSANLLFPYPCSRTACRIRFRVNDAQPRSAGVITVLVERTNQGESRQIATNRNKETRCWTQHKQRGLPLLSRTSAIPLSLLPKQARYRAALRPDFPNIICWPFVVYSATTHALVQRLSPDD